jgi:iron complex outermembrane receptor protein
MKLKNIVQGLVIAGLASHALAQQATQRVEITGSSIKRVQAEGALPVQVIRAADLEKAGISNAEQLVAILPSSGNGVDNMVSNQGGDFLNSLLFSGRGANNGSTGVSLRGLGAQNTLVLLNGRRVAAHGLNGKSVDLNTIPMSAIDRIEILKDGASAIYGTDAIGGVMNFILKKDYNGLELSGFADFTQGGGGDIAKASVTYGVGTLDREGFNFLATLAVDTNSRLRGSQRKFHNGYQPDKGLAPDTTGTPFATVNAAGGTALGGSFTANGQSYNRTNLLALDQLGLVAGSRSCNDIPNTYLYRGDITGFNNNNASCVYDYGKDWSLMQPVDRTNFVSRGSFKIGADSTAYVELMASRTKSAVEYTPNQITTAARGANYPAFIVNAQGQTVRAPYYPLDLAAAVNALVPGRFNTNLPVRIRWRCLDCGPRQQETTSDTYRLLAGLEGTFGAWDYKFGLSRASSKGNTVLGDGNLLEAKFKAAMDTGLINPFLLPGQSQTPEAIALINGAKATGRKLYSVTATANQVDGTISGEIFKLPAGAVSAAVGFDVRKEAFDFRNDQASQTEAIIGVGSPAALPKVDRDIKAVFAELNVPIVKGLEAQLAVRNDRYSDFGATTNPKLALSWRPSSNLLLRGSYNKGFHAPDFGPLYEGENNGQFNSDVNDPTANCPAAGVGFCNIRPGTINGGNPNLKPEKSKQWSFGFVVQPTDWMSASVDFFNVQITDRISNRTPQEVLALNLTPFILRDLSVAQGGDGNNATIDAVRGGWINVAGDKVRGADINLSFNWKTGPGRWSAALDGTWLKSYKSRKSESEPWSERVGEFGDFDWLWDLRLRWKHTANVTYGLGDWSTTLTQVYKSGYKSEVDGYGSGVILQDLGFPSKIKSYALYNLSFSYTGIKNTTLTAGITNLFNTDPPFSNHNVDNVAGAGWDARVGDPRGRAFNLKITHKFF